MSNEEIVKMIQAGIDVTENQERLWLKNKKFISLIIKRYYGYGKGVDVEDLEQQGFIGLITAADRFDFNKGYRFITYAGQWIRQSMFRYSENCGDVVRVPVYLQKRIRDYQRFKKEYEIRTGNPPAEEILCKELKLSKCALQHVEKTIYNMQSVSLDDGIEDMELIDLIDSGFDVEQMIVKSVYVQELHEELNQAFEILDTKTRAMINSIYYQGNTNKRTAEIFGCARQSVYERIGQGFYKILHSEYRCRLESFMDEGYQFNEHAYAGYVNLDNESSEFLV